ncbi:hypothetical protein [Spodoptera cosmioides nucleopolyhedrovirus]|uniref:Chitin-binding type-2 domain-containing protein n=1 Tax=Spodoptera cosmioides nucleopolyhedrovirus TaxID=2605774 RepID=A0A6B7KMM9_9ABAC|nr:hypothetical protein [Spodoptera cosmioides nucleopolyhedrovirus]
MIMQYMIIITIIIIVILLFLFYTRRRPGRYTTVRYLPNEMYSDTFFDTYTSEVKLCPNKCPVFNFQKQKCVKGSITSNICTTAVIGNQPHHYKCDAFFFCLNGQSSYMTCAVGLCYNNDTRLCSIATDNHCNCLPASVCSDCCADDDDDDVEADGNDSLL